MSVLDAWFDFVQAEKISLTKIMKEDTRFQACYWPQRSCCQSIFWCELKTTMSHFTWESANTDVSCHNSNYFSTTIIDNHHDTITTTESASPIDRPNNTNTFPVKCLQTIQDYSPLQNHYQQFLNYKIVLPCKTTTNSFYSYFPYQLQ